MITDNRRYPIGVQTFTEIIKGGYVYVDKTDLMWKMANVSKYVFLSRPRRFGKSLLSSTLHSYFAGQKELFEGLKVMLLEKEWTEYPVIHLDLSLVKGKESADELRRSLMVLLSRERYFEGNDSEKTPGEKLTGMIHRAYNETHRQVAVIIDEYDAPLLEVLHEEENLPAFRKVMQEFFVPLKACDPYIKFCFITGITKFSQLSIFSTINNLKNLSMRPDYSAICGITEQEVRTVFAEDIQMLAGKQQCTPEEMFQKIKNMYDGYGGHLQSLQSAQRFRRRKTHQRVVCFRNTLLPDPPDAAFPHRHNHFREYGGARRGIRHPYRGHVNSLAAALPEWLSHHQRLRSRL